MTNMQVEVNITISHNGIEMFLKWGVQKQVEKEIDEVGEGVQTTNIQSKEHHVQALTKKKSISRVHCTIARAYI